MTELFAMPVCVLPGSSVCPAALPQREAFGEALPQLLPQARGLAFDMRLVAPDGQNAVDGVPAKSLLRDQGALRFLVLHMEGDDPAPAPESLEPLDALRTMEICGQLSFMVNQAFGQHGVSCKVRLYPPVPQSQALGFGALRHAAAAVFERIKQVARETGVPLTDVGVRLSSDEDKGQLMVQLLAPGPHVAAAIAVPVFPAEGGLEAAVASAASALAAAGVQMVECDQASRDPFSRYVQERGKALKVLPSSIRKLMAGRKPPYS